jgi:hypothetical protein
MATNSGFLAGEKPYGKMNKSFLDTKNMIEHKLCRNIH